MSSIYPDGGHRREGSSGDVLDRWYTPDAVARACVERLPWSGRLPMWALEPSVGGGAFARAIRHRWPAAHVLGVDVDPEATGLRDCDEMRVGSWLTPGTWHGREDEAVPCEVVAMNPPYRDAVAHIAQAIHLCSGYSGRWVVGALVRVALLESRERATWWDRHPPAEVHHLRVRVGFGGPAADEALARVNRKRAAEGKPPRSSLGVDYSAYAWMVWRPGHRGPWAGYHLDVGADGPGARQEALDEVGVPRDMADRFATLSGAVNRVQADEP